MDIYSKHFKSRNEEHRGFGFVQLFCRCSIRQSAPMFYKNQAEQNYRLRIENMLPNIKKYMELSLEPPVSVPAELMELTLSP